MIDTFFYGELPQCILNFSVIVIELVNVVILDY